MNLQQMRKIDAHAGVVICVFLEIYERCRRMFQAKREIPPEIKKILVTKYIGMGSIILATPMLQALKTRYPQSKIVFLTFASNAGFARNIQLIDEVIAIRTASIFIFAWDLLQAIGKIRQAQFDIAFDLEFFARFSTIVSFLSATRIRIGYYLPKLWRGDLLTHQVHFNPYRHVTEVFAALLEPLGIEVTDFTLTAPGTHPAQLSWITGLLREKGVGSEDAVIVVNINSSDLSRERRWPRDNFIALINHITLENRAVKVILVGLEIEAAYVRELYELLPEESKGKTVNLSGALDIAGLIALLKISSLFITNDSGPLNVAAALGTATVSFFGPESPALYGPAGEKHLTLYAGIYCSPCLNVYNAKTAMCRGNNICMAKITPAMVIAAMAERKFF